MKNQLPIPSVNFHLWEPCNMRCKFCFATFQDVKKSILPKGHLPEKEAILIVEKIAAAGFKKINFAGGEPTLCPWLPILISTAHQLGMTTSIVTNGSKLTDEWLEKISPTLDWIAISIDSLNPSTNIKSGRAITGKKSLSENYYKLLVDKIKRNNIHLKINTVVSSVNWQENMASFIDFANPKRWKLFEVLPIKGQNDACINDFLISSEQFDVFYQKYNPKPNSYHSRNK